MFFRRKKRTQEGSETEPKAQTGPDGSARTGRESAPESKVMGRSPPSTQFLTGEARKDRHTVQVLLETIARVSMSRDLESLLTDIVDSSIGMTGAERGLLLMRGEGKELDVRVARVRGGKPFEEDVRFSTTIANKVLNEIQPVRATVHSESEMLELGKSVYDLKLREVMCVPLTPPGDEGSGPTPPSGVLYVDSRAATRQFTHEELAAFAALAQQISIAMENARLHQDSLEKVRLEQENNLAASIQRNFMPQGPADIPGWDVHGFYEPAAGTAGDFYDFVRMKDGSVAIVVGDVTGHGIGPALITQTAQASLRSYLRLISDPGEVVTLLNQDLSERVSDGRFLTLFLARLCADGRLHGLNAGHELPLLWRRASGDVEALGKGGPALGMIPDEKYEDHAPITLADGDVLVMYTDGLTEVRAADDPDRLFGAEGVKAALIEAASAGKGAKEICAYLVESAMQLSGNMREDDITVVVACRRDPLDGSAGEVNPA